MNNKGFIATSLVYAFFLVFVAVIATILATYTHNRILINNINAGIEEDLNKSIENKYLIMENLLKNSNFEEDGGWVLNNANNLNPSFSAYLGVRSIGINKGNSSIVQTVNDLKGNHYYYLRLSYFRNGTITGTSVINLQNVANTGIVVNYGINLISDALFVNWETLSGIMPISTDGNYNFQIGGTNIGGTFEHFNVDSLMLIDVTDLISAGNSVSDIKTYMDTFDYFEGKKSIIKP